MILNIRISDELYSKYAKRNAAKPADELEKALAAFQDLDPREARVVVSGEDLKALNRVLGHSIGSAKELLEHVHRSQRVALPDGISIELNQGQRARLTAQADFFNKAGKATPEEFAEFVKRQILAGIVTVVGP